MDSKETVFNVLKEAGTPLKNKDIQEASGLDAKEITKAIDALKKEGRIDSPKRCFYGVKQ